MLGPWCRYMQLRAELQATEDLMRHRTMNKRTRQGHARTRQRRGGGTQREALLDPNAHRRVNRRQVGLMLCHPRTVWLCVQSHVRYQ